VAFWALIVGLWRRHQRNLDLDILWPICKREAAEYHNPHEVLDVARAMFAVHAFNDPAWLCLGEDAIVEFIDRLT
jgi:hypothetical protein